MKALKTQLLSLTFLIGLACQTQAYDIRSGLVSYYTFDTSTTEDVAFTNHFTDVNGATLGAGQRGTTALQLNGTSQYLRYDHPASNAENGFPVYNAGAYSITMWVKGPSQANRYLYAEGSSTSTAPLFLMQTGAGANGSKLDILIRTDGNTTLINHLVSSNVVFDDTWHHIAWVDDNGSVKLYIDGVLDNSNFNYVRGGTFSFDRAAIGNLLRASAANGYFGGSMDDISFWERPLTQSEVQNIMTNGITTPVPALPAAILSHPTSVTKNFQDAVTFSVLATGTRPNTAVTYQWHLDGSAILDATNRTLRIFNLTTANSGEVYSVSVSNAIGGVVSSNAVLTVLADPTPDLRDDLISYWPLDSVVNDEGTYTTIDLYSRNDLLLTNMTEANLAGGQFANALLFDNFSNTAATRSSGSAIYGNAAYSISMWVNADGSFQNDVRVYSEASTNSNAPLFTIGTASPVSPEGVARILIRNDANQTVLNRNSTRTVFDGQWHHIVWVDDNGQGKLYVDGVLDETDFTYSRGPLTANVSSVGAVVRATPVNNTIIFGYIDEVATWARAVTYTEIQEIKNAGIPEPLAPTPPTVTTQPVGADVYTRADVSFSVTVSGTAPFTYQWRKDGNTLTDKTNATLVLSNVQVSDSGAYSVTVNNAGGETNSANAVLNVTTRPPSPSTLALDFNHRAGSFPNLTEAGFSSFLLDNINIDPNTTSVPTTQLFGGAEVSVFGLGTSISARSRSTPTNVADFTEEKLLTDFVYATSGASTNGLGVNIKFMEPNQLYTITIWSFDSVNPSNRVSDWYANGVLVKDNYVFDGAVPPVDNQQYQFSFDVTSDADGHIFIEGRRDETANSVSVFLNALRVALPQTRIGSIERVGGNLRLVLETPDSSVQHTVESADSLTNPQWGSVAGVSQTVLSPTSLQLEFAEPVGETKFYRINRASP